MFFTLLGVKLCTTKKVYVVILQKKKQQVTHYVLTYLKEMKCAKLIEEKVFIQYITHDIINCRGKTAQIIYSI